ncbi:uncharacterized protein PHA67_023431 isoform 1-T2 [Liasis olivaceus]
MYGCQNALIQTLDLYENHGIVPEGPVCSDLAEMPTFPDFCTLTFYRCTLKKYFVKRIQCPDKINEAPATTQNTNQGPGDTESSSTLQETLLISILPTTLSTTKTSPALVISASNTAIAATEAMTTTLSATATGTIPELPTDISAVTASVEPLDPTSSTPITTDSESLLELLTGLDAVIAEQSFPELFTTTGTTPTMTDISFSQHLTFLTAVPSPSPVPTLPSTSSAMTAAPVISVSVVPVSSSEPATTEAAISSTSTTPTMTDESFSQHLTFLATGPSPSPVSTLPSTSNVMTATPSISVSVVPVSSSEPATSEVATPSIPTNPATTVAPASSPTSAPSSPIITVTPTATSTNQPCSVLPFSSSSTASKISILLTKPATPKKPAHLSPPSNVAHWPVVPISAVLGQYPLQPTPIMQLFVLPSGFGPRKPKLQGAIAISPLLPIIAGPANIWQKKKIPEPQANSPTTAKVEKYLLQMNSPTTAKFENFFLRLRDSRVQQMMQKMRELMGKGKAVKKQLLQSTSLQLLSALKNAKQKKSVVSLVSKKQLQR